MSRGCWPACPSLKACLQKTCGLWRRRRVSLPSPGDRLSIDRDNRRRSSSCCGAGEPLGTIAAVEPASTYPVSAVAIEPSEAFGWDGAAITTLMRRFPALAINAMKVTTRRLHDLQRQHREWMTERAENRIALAL